MCVATTTIVAAGIAAGGSIAGAKIASNAAHGAADTQQKAARDALGVQQQQYQQGRQDFSPYQQAGAGAVGRLQQLASAPPPTFNPGQPTQFGSLGNPMGGQMPQPAAQQPAGGAMAPQGMGQPQMVTMRSPDGSTRAVPAHLVQMFQQKGATIVA